MTSTQFQQNSSTCQASILAFTHFPYAIVDAHKKI